MAADQPLSEELTCPVCREGLSEPVRIACGHTFCRACVLQCWGAADGERAACPRCGGPFGEGDVRPAEDLAELGAKAKGREEEANAGAEAGLCERIQQPLRLFCREEQSLICRVCDNSKEHKGHDVVPAEEVAQRGQVTSIAYSDNEVTEVASAVPAPPQFTDVEEDVKCPICHGRLTDPVSVDCGHNYCQTCILRHCRVKEHYGMAVTCPLCQAPMQRENLRSNWPLRNVVEKMKHFPLKLAKENLCMKHKEKLSLFCTEDRELVCIHCKRSSEHRAHNVLLLEEAVEQYEEQSQSHLETLKKDKKELEEQKRAKERRIETCLVHLEQEKKQVRSVFERMQTFLEEKQQLWVGQLEELEEEMKKMQDKDLAKVSKEFSRLTALIAEMEERCLQPESKFLQDTRNALDRCEKNVGCVVNLSPGLEEMLRIHLRKSSDLRKHMRNCKEAVERVLSTEATESALVRPSNADVLQQAQYKVSMIMNPNAQIPEYFMLKDLKISKSDGASDNLQSFNSMLYELKCERLPSGRPWWVVDVLEKGMWKDLWGRSVWAVGVAKHTVMRKDCFSLSPDEGIWAVGQTHSDCSSPCQVLAFTSPEPTLLTLKKEPRKIWVALDFEEGCVDFFDADTDEFIFTFYSLPAEGVQPFFCRGGKMVVRTVNSKEELL